MRFKSLAVSGLLVSALLAACGGPTPSPNTQATNAPDSGYPAEVPTDSQATGYPARPPTPTIIFEYPAASQPTQPALAQPAATNTAAPADTAVPTDAPAATATPGLVIIVYKDFEIQPAQTTVKAGTSVNFFIQGSVHQPYAGSAAPFIFEAPNNLAPGTTWPQTFSTPGTFTLLCGYHSNMSATLVVEP